MHRTWSASHQMFPSTPRLQRRNATISPVDLNGNHLIILIFQKAPLTKCFSSTLKCKVGVYKFSRFEQCFRKAPFFWTAGQTVVLVFSCVVCTVCTGPKYRVVHQITDRFKYNPKILCLKPALINISWIFKSKQKLFSSFFGSFSFSHYSILDCLLKS